MGKDDKSGDQKIPIDDPRVSVYMLQLERCLEQCARDVEARPDAFLWNARRSVEAMLRVIQARLAIPALADTPLDKLLDALEKKHLPQGARSAFRMVQADGNFGVHVQGPEPPDYRDYVKRCRLTLQQAVEWFYKQSDMPQTPEVVNRALDVFAGKAPTFLEQDREEAEAVAAQKLGAALASARRKLEAAEMENTRLQRELDSERARRATARSASEATAGAPGSSSLRAPVLIGAVLGVLLLIGTAAAVRGYGLEGSPPTASAAPPPAQFSSATVGAGSAVTPAGATAGVSFTEGPGAPDAAAPDPASTAPGIASTEASAAPFRNCPDDMIPFAGGDVELGEPYPRPWLKAPRKSGLRATVAPFCLDPHPVRATALWSGKRASEGERGFASTGCNPARAGSKSAVNCVTHIEAETWCKERGARLPNLAEWEYWVSRGADKRVELPGDFEWVADPSPSPAWTRRPPQQCEGRPCFLARHERFVAPPPGEARFSWMRYAASIWLGNLTFRCALDRR